MKIIYGNYYVMNQEILINLMWYWLRVIFINLNMYFDPLKAQFAERIFNCQPSGAGTHALVSGRFTDPVTQITVTVRTTELETAFFTPTGGLLQLMNFIAAENAAGDCIPLRLQLF